MKTKETIDKIDLAIIDQINRLRSCDEKPIQIKRHGLCEVKYIQSEKGDALYSYSEKRIATPDNKFQVQLAHVHRSTSKVNNEMFGLKNDGNYVIRGILLLICYNHSILDEVLASFENMDQVNFISADMDTERNIKSFWKIKRDDKNYNPEMRAFALNYESTFEKDWILFGS